MGGIPNKISHIVPASIVNSENSSTSNITNGGSFPGEWSRVNVGSRLILTCKADQDLTIQVKYSPDGVNEDSSITRYYRTNQIEAPHVFINARPYFKIVVLNNSGADTSVFRLNSYIAQETGVLNIPIDATMSQDYDSISVRPSDFTSEVALGRRQGWSTWNKFGFNLDVDSGADEVVASFGGAFARMTTADTLTLASTSANDASGGTGVNSVVVYGVDENRNEQIEIVTMNGTTPVVTTNQWLGVNRVAIFLAGTGETNAGDIDVTATTATSVQAQMPAGDGVTQQLIFHVPADHVFLTGYIRANVNKISGGGSPRVTIKVLVYSAVNNAIQEIYRSTIDTAVDNFVDVVLPESVPVGEKSIIYMTASTNTNNTIVTGRFGGKLVRDVDA